MCRMHERLGEFVINTKSFPDNLPPPTDLRLADTKSEELIFNWTAPLQHCPSLEYAIYSSGACICPSTSGSNNTLSCIGTQCVIRVYSVVCTYYGRQGIESRTSSNVLSVNITGTTREELLSSS